MDNSANPGGSAIQSSPRGRHLENVLQEFLHEKDPVLGDEQCLELSASLGMVAKILRCAIEDKKRASLEATEWKRKYELECMRSKGSEAAGVGILSSRSKNKSLPQPNAQEIVAERFGTSERHKRLDQNGTCCGKDGICSHEVLGKEGSTSELNQLVCDEEKKISKVPFALSWVCDGIKNKHRNHDVVSFERGDITIAVRSNKQIILDWKSPPQSVAILTKPDSAQVQALCNEMVRWLLEDQNVDVHVEPRVKELLSSSPCSSCVYTWETDEEAQELHTKVDLVITLGGDGTVLWTASMFKGPVPPLVSFAMGSLGFMTPFESDRYRETLQNIMKGPLHITLRHRLICRIVKASDREEPCDAKKFLEDSHLVLNEVAIDRGISPFLTLLECYCDNFFMTSVQGDGLIISTTSGSTAYSLAAGGSMVHPQVPGILFTPICPHSLSFRPLILPEYVTLSVQVPINSRGNAWASFDGKDRQHLQAGDTLVCNMSLWPVPTTCEVDSTHDFLRSVREGLHWNVRRSQSDDAA